MAEPLLEVKDLVAGYDGTAVLRGVSLTVEAGSIVAVLGANGVGKTTLNKVLSGIVRPQAGRGDASMAGASIAPARRHRRGGAGACARGPQAVSGSQRARKPRARLLSARQGRARPDHGARADRVPAPEGTLGAARRHAVGRRTADGRDRPRHDGPAQAADPRRALARAGAAAGRGDVRADPPPERGGPDDPAGRTECRAVARTRRCGACDGARVLRAFRDRRANSPATANWPRAYLGM